jgi:outer membrane protein
MLKSLGRVLNNGISSPAPALPSRDCEGAVSSATPKARRRPCACFRRAALVLLPLLAGQPGFGQSLPPSPDITISKPKEAPVLGPILRPFHFEKRIVSPPRLANTSRLESLVRGGNLYLSVQDVIALVLENNLDIEIQRYGPFLAREVERRSHATLLRDISSPILAGPTSVSTAGVSLNVSGLVSGAGTTAGGGVVTGIGPTPPDLDPNLFAGVQAGHLTTPVSNTTLNQTDALINDFRTYYVQYTQQFSIGTNAQFTYASTHSRINSPTPFLNPQISGELDLYVTQPLLQGFSLAVNNRNIRVARNNQKVTDLQLKQQVITTVSAALNLYWDLVTFDDTVRISQQAVATAQKLYEDNQAEAKLGALASIEVTRAAAALSAVKENLLIAQTNVAQQETVLKNALSRSGPESAWLDDVHIVPLDHIEIPKTETLKPTPELIQQALASRPEVEQNKINLISKQLLLKGDRNGLLPNLTAFAELTSNGLSGPVNPLYNGASGVPDPYFVGGYGNFAAQLLRRNFPNYSAGISLNIAFRNRAAQADYAIDALQLRQNELQLSRTVNQVNVEVKNNVIGLQQARARFETAVNTRLLAEQNLQAEQNRFKFGAVPDATLVIQAQNEVATVQTAELQSMANYTHAKIAFDQALGQTLEVNRIAMAEAASGRVARQSAIPDSLPGEKKP